MAGPPRSGRRSQTLPRPPTPPRETEKPETDVRTTEAITISTTPQSTPTSSIYAVEKLRKKVGWSGLTEFCEPPDHSSPFSIQSLMSPLTRSAERKAAKSILKPYNANTSAMSSFGDRNENQIALLDSVLKQLASNDRTSRNDAYITFSTAMKTSGDFPDPRLLKDKIVILSGFILRDLEAALPEGGPDVVLNRNTLYLLTNLIWNRMTAELLRTEFCIQVVEYSIKALANEQTSKEVIKRILFILYEQNFSSKIVTPDRAKRLITTIHTLGSHVKGKSIAIGRILLYKKLADQAPAAMLTNTIWLEALLKDFVHSSEEVRREAMVFGAVIAQRWGKEKQISKAVHEFLDKKIGEHRYLDWFAGKLVQTVREKQSGAVQVPRVWGIVILFLRCRTHQLEQWQHMRSWLMVAQTCFNSSDNVVKAAANDAWVVFIFSVQPSEKTAPALSKMLIQPIIGQLSRKLSGEYADETRQAQLRAVRTLIYQSMMPTASQEQLTRYWNEYVVELISALTSVKETESTADSSLFLAEAFQILKSLFNVSGQKSWDENRAIGMEDLTADDLIGISPTWLRKSAPMIVPLIGSLMDRFYSEMSSDNSQILQIWSSYVTAVAAAGVKEVKVSDHTMSFICSLLELLWLIRFDKNAATGSGERPAAEWMKVFGRIMSPVLTNLGSLPFTARDVELKASQDGSNARYVLSSPGPNGSGKRRGFSKPWSIIYTIMRLPPQGLDEDEHLQVVGSILDKCSDRVESKQPQLLIWRDLIIYLRALRSECPSFRPETLGFLWSKAAELIRRVINADENSISTLLDSPECSLSAKYSELVKLLEVGIELSTPERIVSEWEPLFQVVCKLVTNEAGAGGCALAVLEPLAKFSTENLTGGAAMVDLVSILVHTAKYPRNVTALDAARRRLSGKQKSASRKAASVDPYDNLYALLNTALRISYHSESFGLHLISLCRALIQLLSQCPSAFFVTVILRVQEGLSLWIEDSKDKARKQEQPDVSQEFTKVWEKVCAKIKGLGKFNSALLKTLELLICTGFNSHDKSRISITAKLWNATFGQLRDLQYPESVKEILLRLRNVAILKLPGLPLEETTTPILPPVFSASDSFSQEVDAIPRPSPLTRSSRNRSPLNRPDSSASKKRKSEESLPSSKRKARKQTTPKLPHDDSQISFTAIESSPVPSSEINSQFLTEHQREVKEKQASTAALFPDIRSSSPVPLPKLDMTPSVPRAQSKRGLSTPTLKEVANTLDYWTGSSPTPRRPQASSLLQTQVNTDDNIPSSPPQSRESVSANMGNLATLPVDESNSTSKDRNSPDLPQLMNTPGNPSEIPETQSQDSVASAKASKKPVRTSKQLRRSTRGRKSQDVEDTAMVEVDRSIILPSSSSPAQSPMPPRRGRTRSAASSQLTESENVETSIHYESEADKNYMIESSFPMELEQDLATSAVPTETPTDPVTEPDTEMGETPREILPEETDFPGSPSMQLLNSMSFEATAPSEEVPTDTDSIDEKIEVLSEIPESPDMVMKIPGSAQSLPDVTRMRQASVELGEVIRDEISVAPTPAQETAQATTAIPAGGAITIESIISLLQNAAQSLQQITLSREELRQVEDVFIDTRREMYLAEERSKRL